LEQENPRFDEGSLRLLDQRNHAKMQWLEDPNQSNVDNLHNERHEDSRHFRNKWKDYLEDKID
jgi:hypothetical protein